MKLRDGYGLTWEHPTASKTALRIEPTIAD
jgi:hypothetical protein